MAQYNCEKSCQLYLFTVCRIQRMVDGTEGGGRKSSRCLSEGGDGISQSTLSFTAVQPYLVRSKCLIYPVDNTKAYFTREQKKD